MLALLIFISIPLIPRRAGGSRCAVHVCKYTLNERIYQALKTQLNPDTQLNKPSLFHPPLLTLELIALQSADFLVAALRR